jgi:uncharacterized protein (TIGR03067 family)
MRRLPLLAAVLALLLLGSDSPKEYDDRAQDSGLEGEWVLLRLEVNGKLVPEWPSHVTTYRGGRMQAGEAEGTYTVDDLVRPARLTERIAVTGETFPSIYQIAGKTLRVAFLKSLTDYPTGFSDKRELVIEVYRRVQ